MSTREYDRFGPWVTVISEADPVPPLFQPHAPDVDRALMSIKIPRRIERREANPDMDLYDYLISLYDEEIVVLKRDGKSVTKRTSRYDELRIVHYIENLLDGRLRMALPGGELDIPFNSVSSDVMQQFCARIRDKYTHRERRDPGLAVNPDVGGSLSFYFRGYLGGLRSSSPAFSLCASQAEMPVGKTEVQGLRRLLFRILMRRLTESLHLTDGRELVIVHHGQKYRHLRQTLYACHTSYIPVDRITDVQWNDDPQNEAIVNLVVTASDAAVTIPFMTNNPSRPAYAELLAGYVAAK